MDILRQEILEQFVSGRAPSAIDKELRLADGYSHDVVVSWWNGWSDGHESKHASEGAAAINASA